MKSKVAVPFHVKHSSLTPQEFQYFTGVDDATIERLDCYLDLLMRWQCHINLVGSTTLVDPWRRHFLDSAQVISFLPTEGEPLVDLGSGAGFPGLIIALITGRSIHLVDSDARKCAFLREATRVTESPTIIHNCRIETLPLRNAAVVMARALAPLERLLPLIWPLMAPKGIALLLKGRTAVEELTLSRKNWRMITTATQSQTDPEGWVVTLQEIEPRHDR